MINHKHKFIFIHIPKTAGLSIYSQLPLRKHIHKKLSNYDNDKINEYFTFSFVRNPFDRTVSTYHFLNSESCMKWPRSNRKIHNLVKSMTFSEFIKNLFRIRNKHLESQFNYIAHNSLKINFIGKFENLQEDFNIICDKIGIPRQQLPYKNKSKHKHYTEYYDEETKQIVAERYAKDIEYFRYEFGE